MPTNLFIAVGLDGLRIASADGQKWTDAQTGREGESYRAVAFGNGLSVAVGSFGGDNILATTSDGKTWKTGKHEAKYVKYMRPLLRQRSVHDARRRPRQRRLIETVCDVLQRRAEVGRPP